MAIRRHFIFSIRTQCESFSGKGRWEDEESVRRWGSWSGWISILLQEIENALHSLFAVKRRLFLICLGVSIGIIVSGDRTKLVKGNGGKKTKTKHETKKRPKARKYRTKQKKTKLQFNKFLKASVLYRAPSLYVEGLVEVEFFFDDRLWGGRRVDFCIHVGVTRHDNESQQKNSHNPARAEKPNIHLRLLNVSNQGWYHKSFNVQLFSAFS